MNSIVLQLFLKADQNVNRLFKSISRDAWIPAVCINGSISSGAWKAQSHLKMIVLEFFGLSSRPLKLIGDIYRGTRKTQSPIKNHFLESGRFRNYFRHGL